MDIETVVRASESGETIYFLRHDFDLEIFPTCPCNDSEAATQGEISIDSGLRWQRFAIYANG